MFLGLGIEIVLLGRFGQLQILNLRDQLIFQNASFFLLKYLGLWGVVKIVIGLFVIILKDALAGLPFNADWMQLFEINYSPWNDNLGLWNNLVVTNIGLDVQVVVLGAHNLRTSHKILIVWKGVDGLAMLHVLVV